MIPLLHATADGHLDWNWHPDVIFVCALLLGGYFYLITQLREEISDAWRVKPVQIGLYLAGVLVLYVASSAPLHQLAEQYLASAHMLQHLLYTLVAPPLLIAGIPAWLYRAPLRNRVIFRVARVLTFPLVAFGVFNAVQLVTHFPSAVNLALDVHVFHLFVHVGLVATALMMWWPILSPIDELPRLSYPLQMAYLFLVSLLPSVLAAFITFSTGVFYSAYADAPRMWGISAIEDQQIAGFVMKIIGSIILWSFIAYAFFRWYERENRRSQEPFWDDVSDEMRRLGLPIERGGGLN